jgi:hypothetical protein
MHEGIKICSTPHHGGEDERRRRRRKKKKKKKQKRRRRRRELIETIMEYRVLRNDLITALSPSTCLHHPYAINNFTVKLDTI